MTSVRKGPVQMLGHESEILRLSHEARPRWHVGPQGACHAAALELCLIESGAEHGRIDGETDALGAGTFNLIPPGVVHSSWTEGRGVQECIVHLPTTLLARVADELGVKKPQWAVVRAPTPPPLRALVESLKWEARTAADQPGHVLVLESLATAIAALVLRGFQTWDEQTRGAQTPASRLRAVEELLRSDPGASPSLDQLAALCGMSRFHFLRRFKRQYGMPPHAYLLRLKVERAAELLRRTEMPLTTIAYDLGFGSSSRLTEAFARRFGQPPSRWRLRPGAAIPGSRPRNIRVSAARATR
ncbi:MAG: helix-turn-helix transcriptional regulator [Deltaproteobacteria bacterium]|nr:helix-turn-helix transcriptional regulator [Deltaproteobacteria bacterium]